MSKLKKLNIVNYISENETTFNIELTYEIFGKPIGEAPIVLVNHALTGNSRITGLGGSVSYTHLTLPTTPYV